MSKDAIKNIRVYAYTIPTDYPETDGTLEWNSTTLVLVEIEGGGKKGIGYTYGDLSAARLIDKNFRELLVGKDALQLPATLPAITNITRNNGNCGITSMAISAVDCALWDLKAKILDMSLASLLGIVHSKILVYGSGNFTSYPTDKLQEQFSNWTDKGIQYIKMKIGRKPDEDIDRVKAVREAIGKNTRLFVDANGAYSVNQAIEKAGELAELGVTWFEEPVSSEDLEGLRNVQQNVPPGMNITAGEYGYNLEYFKKMIAAGAVNIIQADATRCGGISGFLKAGYLCEANHIPFSFHCAPALHMQAATALPSFYIGEYYHEHVRIEQLLFDGVKQPVNGYLQPDPDAPGLGITFKFQDAEKYQV